MASNKNTINLHDIYLRKTLGHMINYMSSLQAYNCGFDYTSYENSEVFA